MTKRFMCSVHVCSSTKTAWEYQVPGGGGLTGHVRTRTSAAAWLRYSRKYLD